MLLFYGKPNHTTKGFNPKVENLLIDFCTSKGYF